MAEPALDLADLAERWLVAEPARCEPAEPALDLAEPALDLAEPALDLAEPALDLDVAGRLLVSPTGSAVTGSSSAMMMEPLENILCFLLSLD